MKKSLVLAMAMALGVTASAYAANPFSDVPAGHWAYDSVAELAANGVIDGYTDGSFGGDKLMTRYEMAQIVARAMANGADVDALAAEFAEELDTLGVRIANLEKKADNVKITGQIRARYIDQDYENNFGEGSVADLRTRLWVKGDINDNWKYTGMLQNVQDFRDNGGNDDTDLKRAYLEGRLGGTDVTVGRYNAFLGDGLVYDDNVDGVEATYGDKIKVTGFYGQYDSVVDDELEPEYWALQATTDLGPVNLMAGYASFDYDHEDAKVFDNDIFYVVAGAEVAKHLNAKVAYLKADTEDSAGDELPFDDDGFAVELSYKGADKADVGSWGLTANYWDQGLSTYAAHTTDANTFSIDGRNYGFKGFGVAADYTVAKNIVATVAYYDTEIKEFDEVDDQRLWTSVQFYF